MATKKSKPNTPRVPKAPRLPSATDLIRGIYEQAGATSAYHYKKKHATDFQRLLTAIGKSEGLANALSEKEQATLEADLSALGLHPGRVSLTLPERLVLKWAIKNGYSFGGVWPEIRDPNADVFSQYPINGGRARSGGGTMVDCFFSPSASKTAKGLSLAVDGLFYHSKVAQASRDTSIDLVLRAQGYKTARITDAQTLQPGVLDAFMTSLVGKK